MNEVILNSTITCPECGFTSKETMLTNSCQFFWVCTSCEAIIKPKKGDCCVFCSFGDNPCPPVQNHKACC
jgi:hypothetical protein